MRNGSLHSRYWLLSNKAKAKAKAKNHDGVRQLRVLIAKSSVMVGMYFPFAASHFYRLNTHQIYTYYHINQTKVLSSHIVKLKVISCICIIWTLPLYCFIDK